MDKHYEKEKLQFQVERIAFLSDAVIAIAVTLLIFEIKAPQIEPGASFDAQLAQLKKLFPQFIAFVISFVIILLQWKKHHSLFGRVTNYDNKLLVLNSAFLFVTTFIPFSTSYFAQNSTAEFYLPVLVYGISLFLLSILNYFVFDHVTNAKNNLFDKTLSKPQLKHTRIEYLIFPIGLLAGLAAGFISPVFGFIAYALIVVLGSVIHRKNAVA
ncbi:MAG: DUF1211 domain-containing protein [Bacteroidia bacterium]|nr:DUF1211 domain-containing protein [Bacteroidia bacterium]